MQNRRPIPFAIALFALSIVGSAQNAVDFTSTNMAGEEVSLTEYRGQPVLLMFGPTW